MNSRSFLPAVFIVAAVLGHPCAVVALNARPASDELRRQADQAVADLEFAYASRLPARFLALTAYDFVKKPDVQLSLESYFQQYRVLQVHCVADGVFDEDEFVRVALHWYKTTIDQAGATALSQGSAELVFRKENRTLRLKGVRGENPFF